VAGRESHGHGHGHSHTHSVGSARHQGRPALILLALLGVVAAAAVAGIVAMWPSHSAVEQLRGSETLIATNSTFVSATVDTLTSKGATVTLTSGPEKSQRTSVDLPPPVIESGIGHGTELKLTRTEPGSGAPVYAFFGVERGTSLWILVAIFVVVLLLIGGLRGLMALAGLLVSGLAIWYFLLPALLTGHNAPLVAMCGATVILIVVLYTTHGFRAPTTAALAGTILGAAVTVAIGQIAISGSHLTGVTGDEGGILSTSAPHLDFQEVLVAATLVAALGVLNDVTITQSSAVWELRSAAPEMSRLQLWRSAMRIGRDHIASTVYTIVFAYVGAALMVLMVLELFDQTWVGFMGTEPLVEEVVRTLVGSIGLVLAVPITTVFAVLVAQPAPADEAELVAEAARP